MKTYEQMMKNLRAGEPLVIGMVNLTSPRTPPGVAEMLQCTSPEELQSLYRKWASVGGDPARRPVYNGPAKRPSAVERERERRRTFEERHRKPAASQPARREPHENYSRETWAAAIHESGHATCAHVRGVLLDEVTATDGAATTYFKATPALLDQAVMSFGGPLAEICTLDEVMAAATPESMMQRMSSADFRVYRSVTACFDSDPWDQRVRTIRAFREARQIITAHSRTVMDLAKHLASRGRMSGAEVHAFLSARGVHPMDS